MNIGLDHPGPLVRLHQFNDIRDGEPLFYQLSTPRLPEEMGLYLLLNLRNRSGRGENLPDNIVTQCPSSFREKYWGISFRSARVIIAPGRQVSGRYIVRESSMPDLPGLRVMDQNPSPVIVEDHIPPGTNN